MYMKEGSNIEVAVPIVAQTLRLAELSFEIYDDQLSERPLPGWLPLPDKVVARQSALCCKTATFEISLDWTSVKFDLLVHEADAIDTLKYNLAAILRIEPREIHLQGLGSLSAGLSNGDVQKTLLAELQREVDAEQ